MLQSVRHFTMYVGTRKNIIDWFTRLESRWGHAPTSTVNKTEKDQIVKSQLWTGLYDDRTKKTSSGVKCIIDDITQTGM